MIKNKSASIFSAFIAIVPQVLWIALALYAFRMMYVPLLALFAKDNIEQISIWQIQIKMAQKSLSESTAREGAIKTPEQFKPYEERIKRLGGKITGASILWVDDNHPTQNLGERRAFTALGMNVDMVNSTQDAMKMIDITSYDLIISDINRANQVDNDTNCGNGLTGAGCGLLKSLSDELGSRQPPTILYTAAYDPKFGTPSYAFAITNRIDHLLEYILDAVERRSPPIIQ